MILRYKMAAQNKLIYVIETSLAKPLLMASDGRPDFLNDPPVKQTMRAIQRLLNKEGDWGVEAKLVKGNVMFLATKNIDPHTYIIDEQF